jgi:hypothetical protein
MLRIASDGEFLLLAAKMLMEASIEAISNTVTLL